MFRSTFLALSMLTAVSAPAFASGLSAAQTVEVATVITDENGNKTTVYKKAEEVAPGNEVRYILDFANDGEAPASNVRLDMPVPAEIELIEGSVETGNADVTYSVDSGETFSRRGDLTVSVNGSQRVATAEEITHIRWTFSEAIAPGDAGQISYRGVLQ